MKAKDLKLFGIRSVVLTVVLGCAVAAFAQNAEVVATWRGGSITAEDVAYYCQMARYPYGDPVDTMRHSRLPEERKDAAYFVELVAKERAWEQHWAAKARSLCPDLETTVSRLARPLFVGCVVGAWRAQVLREFTTPPLDQVIEAGLRHRQRLEHEELREVRYIFRSTTATRTQDERRRVQEEMEKIYRLLVENRINFADAAKLYSEAPSSARGGKLGVISRKERYNPRFMDFVFSLPKDIISSPTLLHNGYYIAQVTQIYPAVRVTTETIRSDPDLQAQIQSLMRDDFVKNKIRNLLGSEQQTSVTDALLAERILERMTTPTECAKKELFFRERVLARTCFLDSHAEQFRPTEADARAYYTSNSKAMRKEGYLKYTRFFVPYGTSRYPTRNTALEALRQFRQLLEKQPGMRWEELQPEAQKLGVEITEQKEWAMASDEPKADDELVKITTGSLTSNILTKEGVAFYRLDGRRERPYVSFEECRDFCFEQARLAKAADALKQAIEDFAREQELKIVIPLPK